MAKEFVIFPIIPFLENKILDLLLPKITPKIYEKFATVTQEALFQTNIKNFSAKRLFKAITPHEVLLERIEFKIIQSAISLINLPTGLFYYPLLSSLNIWRVGEVYGQQKDKINPSEIISTTLLSLPPLVSEKKSIITPFSQEDSYIKTSRFTALVAAVYYSMKTQGYQFNDIQAYKELQVRAHKYCKKYNI